MKALLVEDDKFFQKFHAAKLKQHNLETSVATDGEEALKMMKENPPDIVLLDMIMPKKDGFKVLEELQHDSELKHIPVIVFSNLEHEEDVVRAKQLGAIEYINKGNFTFEELYEKIDRVINPKQKNMLH